MAHSRLVCRLLGLMLVLVPVQARAAATPRPDVLIISIDTLRPDRMSSYGYERRTSPNLDQLIGAGAKFTEARTVEPLTSPAICSMFTSLHPHQHGSTRNGLRMVPGLDSMPKRLRAEGYLTAAFVGNWTLRDKLSGLAEHFERYEELLTRKRWFGLVSGETSADDITSSAIDWLQEHGGSRPRRPFLLWLHYVEPHAPYKPHKEHMSALGLERGKLSPEDRYDTEIAYVDRSIGELLETARKIGLLERTLIAFISDHGESLGEHGYWGHGRQLNEASLRIPMAFTWRGRFEPRTVGSAALNTDLAPTILGLLGLEVPASFTGYDWTGVLLGGPAPEGRLTRYQAHKGAVLTNHDSKAARRSGLLEVGQLWSDRKELYRIENGRHKLYDLAADPLEATDLTLNKAEPSQELEDWLRVVFHGLNSCDAEPIEPPDAETVERLRSLGYAD